MPNEAFIYDAVRTPRGRGKQDGSLHEVQPVDLLASLLRALQVRNDLDTSQVDDVVIGCVTPLAEQGGVIARAAVLHAGWETNVPGVQMDRFCASGLEAVNTAAMQVRSGWHDLVVAGGVESMSRLPMGSDGGAWFMDPRVNLESGFVPQGISADLIATIEGFSRDDVDHYALQSQQRATHAEQNNYFKSRIPVRDLNGLLILEREEHIRANTTLERLGNLNPAFEMVGIMGFDAVALDRYPKLERIEHVHTAGNSSGIVDGAAAVLIGSKEMGERLGLVPRARIVSGAVIGTEPTIMLTGPGPASKKALAKAGMNVKDIDLFEVNEAFAVVPMRFVRDLNLDGTENVNVNGGAIAMGHPLGATGAMLLGTLLDELERTDLETGLVTLCVGGGMGIATIVERVSEMKDGIELKIIYLDVNFLEIHARATNGRFAGETDMYVPRSSFADLANTLVGFPNQPQDERSFELGEFNPKAAGGGLRLRFYCLDRLGRAGADIELRNDPHKSGHAEATSFFLALEATAIDEFVTELRNAKLELDASALLRGD